MFITINCCHGDKIKSLIPIPQGYMIVVQMKFNYIALQLSQLQTLPLFYDTKN